MEKTRCQTLMFIITVNQLNYNSTIVIHQHSSCLSARYVYFITEELKRFLLYSSIPFLLPPKSRWMLMNQIKVWNNVFTPTVTWPDAGKLRIRIFTSFKSCWQISQRGRWHSFQKTNQPKKKPTHPQTQHPTPPQRVGILFFSLLQYYCWRKSLRSVTPNEIAMKEEIRRQNK